tara:strand:- start:348 stop:506 length:159 start_codon:yes stop_codon:yes gene_type:complete
LELGQGVKVGSWAGVCDKMEGNLDGNLISTFQGFHVETTKYKKTIKLILTNG